MGAFAPTIGGDDWMQRWNQPRSQQPTRQANPNNSVNGALQTVAPSWGPGGSGAAAQQPVGGANDPTGTRQGTPLPWVGNQPQPTAPAQPIAQGPAGTAPAYTQTPIVSDPYATDPSYGVASVLQGFAPQAAASTNALNNTLAAMGITGGGAVDAQTALQSQLTGALAPQLGATYGQYANNSLQQALANASNTQQGNEFNAGSFNSLQQLLMQLQQSGWNTQAGALTGLYGQGLGNAGSLGNGIANNFPIQSSNGLSSIGSAIGGYRAPTTTPTPQPAPVTVSGGEDTAWG